MMNLSSQKGLSAPVSNEKKGEKKKKGKGKKKKGEERLGDPREFWCPPFEKRPW